MLVVCGLATFVKNNRIFFPVTQVLIDQIYLIDYLVTIIEIR